VTVQHLHSASLTRDPGYLPERAWRDADGYDIEQDERWDRETGGDFLGTALPNPDGLPAIGVGPEDFLPPGSHSPGVVPGAADRDTTPSQSAPADSSGRRAHSSS
jgi:hypothetical protein